MRSTLLIGLGCALLTLFFFAVRFPYDVFRVALASQLAALSGARVEIGALSGGLGLGGLSLVAAPVTLQWPASSLAVERAAIRPAWSLSWLRGQPALHADLRAPEGSLDGTIWPGDPLAFDGRIEGLALERLPSELLAAAQGFALTGRLDADLDLTLENGVVGGDVELDVHDGAFAPPGSPLSIPFERFQAALAIDPKQASVRIGSATLEGPMVEGSAEGSIGLSADPALDLSLKVRIADPNLRGSVAPLGVQLDRDGSALFRVRGSASNPILR